ncbi:MAG: ATP-binding protein [Pirellulaceae bacterium]
MQTYRVFLGGLFIAIVAGLPFGAIVISSVPLSYRGTVAWRFAVCYLVLSSAILIWRTLRYQRRVRCEGMIVSWIGALAAGQASYRLHPQSGIAEQSQLIHNLNSLAEAMQRRIQKLQDDRRRSFMVLAHMVEGIIAVDDEGRVLLVNEAARHFLRLSSENAVGRHLLEVIRIPEVTALVNDTQSSGDDAEVEIRGGDSKSLLVKASTLPSSSRPGVLLTIHDQTQVKHLESMRREFIANVSHELKTPLAAVKGYAETLHLGAIDDKEMAPHFVSQILAQTDRLERLIADMIQLAKAQDRSQTVVIEPVLVEPIVEQCIATYEPVAAQKQIELNVEPIGKSMSVMGEHEALLTVMNNLVGNAIRYTPSGGHVRVGCQVEDESIVIWVTDDGIGIPKVDQERIFERFYRVEKARDLKFGGTGLGLAIVKNIVQSLHGTVRLESQPGVGSTFSIVLLASSVHEAESLRA